MDGVTREYEKVLGTNPKDESVRAVANLNIVATRAAGSGLFDSYKRLKKLHEKELNPRQRRAVALNRAILQMHMGKVDDCRASLKELMSTGEKAPGQDMDLVSMLRSACTKRTLPDASRFFSTQRKFEPLRRWI